MINIVLDNLADGAMLLNAAHRVEYLNPCAQRVFPGLKPGDDFFDFLGKVPACFKGKVELTAVEGQLNTGDALDGELILNPGDEESNFRIVFAPLKLHGALRRTVVSLHDMTEMRQMDKLKSDFVATVSHELRTPLTVISEALNLLRTEVVGTLNPGQKECVGMAGRNIDRLTKLVNNVLDLSKIEAGRLEVHLERLDLVPVLKHVVESFQPVYAKKKLSLKLTTKADFAVRADVDKLEQVLTNLLNNSYKFTETKGRVEVSAGPSPDGQQVRISVKDNGIGIALKDQVRLFSKFVRVGDRYTRQSGGAGLGLYITKRLIEAQGGAIGVRSDRAQGTEMSFTLPLYKEEN
ncbi:MAG: ATP-binding protein [Candidatus Margulisiibacteriota bacterium]